MEAVCTNTRVFHSACEIRDIGVYQLRCESQVWRVYQVLSAVVSEGQGVQENE